MQSITGTWQLVHTRCVADDGQLLPAPYAGNTAMGLVSLRPDGRMICVLCDSRHDLPADSDREYNSYCGHYRYDDNQLITRVDASANAAWLGGDQVRDVSFEGETSQYLQAGSNVFTMAAGFVAQVNDHDDFEFVNPVIRFMP